MTLADHLSVCYAADYRNHGRLSDCIAAFAADMKANQELRNQAGARLGDFTQRVLDRDHISRKHKQYIESALRHET